MKAVSKKELLEYIKNNKEKDTSVTQGEYETQVQCIKCTKQFREKDENSIYAIMGSNEYTLLYPIIVQAVEELKFEMNEDIIRNNNDYVMVK